MVIQEMKIQQLHYLRKELWSLIIMKLDKMCINKYVLVVSLAVSTVIIIMVNIIRLIPFNDEEVVNFKFMNIIDEEKMFIFQRGYIVTENEKIMEIIPDQIPNKYTCVTAPREETVRIIYSGGDNICIDIYPIKNEDQELMFNTSIVIDNDHGSEYHAYIRELPDDRVDEIQILRDSWIFKIRFIDPYDFQDEVYETMNIQTTPRKLADFKQILGIVKLDDLIEMEKTE